MIRRAVVAAVILGACWRRLAGTPDGQPGEDGACRAVTRWAAPAARPFTVLHTVDACSCSEPVMTACCGEVMDPADLWTTVERQPGDRVCPGATTQEGIF